MSPGIGLMDRRLKTEKDAVSLAMSGILKEYKIESEKIKTLETKYDDDAGDWYVALGWEKKRAIVKMDSVLYFFKIPVVASDIASFSVFNRLSIKPIPGLIS